MIKFLKNLFCSCEISQLKDLDSLIDKRNITITNQKEQIEKLKSELKKQNNISGFETWLNNRFENVNLIYTKRWIYTNDKKYKMNITDFIQNWDSLPIKQSIGDCFKHYIRYVYDNYENTGCLDFWQIAPETYILGKGDCDDSGILKACLARRMGNNNVFCALGFYENTGHLFNIEYKVRDGVGKAYIVENTTNDYIPLEIDMGKITERQHKYKIYFIFNENQSWKIQNGSNVRFGEIFKDFGIKLENRKD